MTTDEFIKKVEELGYIVSEDDSFLLVYSEATFVNFCLLDLRINQQYSLRMRSRNFSNQVEEENKRKQLYDLAVEYDRTPVEERGEKRKYQLLPNLDVFYLSGYSLGMNRKSEKVMFPCPYVENEFYQKKFTDTDIKKMPKWVKNFIEQGYLIKEEVEDDF